MSGELQNQSMAELLPQRLRHALGRRNIVLVGMMGAGKSSIGRRLAAALDLPFVDADVEIERAAGMNIEEIFRDKGEAYFRDGEERVIRRLLQNGPQVLATGGGAVMSEATRAEIRRTGISIWLNAPIDLLLQRVARRDNRPLLKSENPRAVLERLMSARERFYRQADLIFESRDAPHETIVAEVMTMLEAHLVKEAALNRTQAASL